MNQEKLTKLQNNVRIGGKVRGKTEFIEMSMKILLRTLFLCLPMETGLSYLHGKLSYVKVYPSFLLSY